MLCQFTVRNFKSIRDEVTFDMQAAAISEHEDRIIKDTDDELYLPVSAVYFRWSDPSRVLAERQFICQRNFSTIFYSDKYNISV